MKIIPLDRKVGVLLIVVSVLIGLTAAVLSDEIPPVNTMSGTALITPGSAFYLNFTIAHDHSEILYDIEVVSGPPVDFYVMTKEDFARYVSGQPPVLAHLSHESIDSAHESPYMPAGEHVAIIDNTDFGTRPERYETVTVTYLLKGFSIPGQDPGFRQLVVAVHLGALLGAIAMFTVGLGLLLASLAKDVAQKRLR